MLDGLGRDGAERIEPDALEPDTVLRLELTRADRVGLEPFTDSEIDRFAAHARRLGRAGVAAGTQRLRELGRELLNRGISARRCCRRAGAWAELGGAERAMAAFRPEPPAPRRT